MLGPGPAPLQSTHSPLLSVRSAYDYLKTAPGLANSFYIPYEQSLTESSTTAACPTQKVAAIDGPLQELSGGFAQVSGYHYAVPPCTSGGCTTQDLNKLAQALETTPVSVCVNAGPWNDYTGGIMTAATCPADAALQVSANPSQQPQSWRS